MSLFWTILVNNILPIYAIAGTGFLLERTLHLDKRTLSRLILYLLAPCLVFSSMMATAISPLDLGRLLGAVGLLTAAMVGIALGLGKLLRWPAKQVDGLVLSVAFINAGNLGLSVAMFAFGEAGLALATIFYVGTNLAVNTVGAFFAARSNGGARRALGKVLRLPGMYAFVLAMLLRALGVTIPPAIIKPIDLIAKATVPLMLIMLGVQLSQTKLAGKLGGVSLAVAVRLVGGALVALLIAPLLGMQGLARQIVILESATPTAVNSSLLAIEFDADPEFVSSAIFISTLISSITLTVILALLT